MIHWTEIVKHTTPKVLWSIIAYFIVLIWVSLSFLKKPQEKETPANPDCIPCEEIPDNPDYIQLGKQETIYWRPALPHSTGRFQSAGTVYQNAQASFD